MLEDFKEKFDSKENFLYLIGSTRRHFERFLKGHQIEGSRRQRRITYRDQERVYRLYPRYEREIEVGLGSDALSGRPVRVHINVRTDGNYFAPYSEDIEKSLIRIEVTDAQGLNPDLSVSVVLPVVDDFISGRLSWEKYKDVPLRLSDVIPHLVF